MSLEKKNIFAIKTNLFTKDKILLYFVSLNIINHCKKINIYGVGK